MTHDELLAKIKKTGSRDGDPYSVTELRKAIIAVVELHKPQKSVNGYVYCPKCRPQLYPCPTIQAIEKELK